MKEIQSLKDIFLETPHIRLATEADNQTLLDFYHQSAMTDKDQSIKYGRGNNFFNFLKTRSDKYLVLTIWDDHNCLQGVGVISYRTGYINQTETMIGYLGDLRVNFNKKLIREWRKFYSLLIQNSANMPETFFCKYYQTVIIDQNPKAKSTLVENKIPNINYNLLEKYKMINIIGRIKFHPEYFSIGHIDNTTFEEVKTFMVNNDQLRNFGRNWNTELHYRLKNWSHFTYDNILVIKNSKNKIIAVTSIWNPISSKQVIVTKVPLLFKLIVPILNLIPFIEMKPLPIENSPIEILYLNQFIFDSSLSQSDKKKIVSQTIHQVFKHHFSILAYADFESQNLMKDNFLFLTNKINMSMYTVHPTNENHENIFPINYTENLDPAFDMTLV